MGTTWRRVKRIDMNSNVLFVVVLIVVVAIIVIWIAMISARAKRISAASDARLAAQLQDMVNNPEAAKAFADETPAERSEQVITMARQDDAIPPVLISSTKEERLAELSDLHAKGAITDDELTAARAKILAE
jgi:uncharacterized membrane protein